MNGSVTSKWRVFLSRAAFLCGAAAFCYTGVVILAESVLLAVLCFLLAASGIAGFVYRIVRGAEPADSKSALRRRAIVSGAMLIVFLLLVLLGQVGGIVIAFAIVVFLFLLSDLAGIRCGED